MSSLEPSPTIDVVDFEEEPRTPTRSIFNVADIHDWRSRANAAEMELSTERRGLQREKRRNRRLQTEVKKCYEILALSKQVAYDAMSQCQYLLNVNALLSKEIEKQRIAVGTLEGVIRRFCIQAKDGGTDRGASPCQEMVVGRLMDVESDSP